MFSKPRIYLLSFFKICACVWLLLNLGVIGGYEPSDIGAEK